MSLNICSFPYAAQLRLGLKKLKISSNAISDGTVIKSQCLDQIVVWVITSFFFSSPAVLFGYWIHKWPLWLLSSCHFYPQGGFVLRVGESVLHIICGMVREPLR